MLKQHSLLPLFQKFIVSSRNGRRLNKNGTRIKLQSVNNYTYCKKLLEEFYLQKQKELIVYEVKGNNKKEHSMLKKYWNNFYIQFTDFLTKQKNCSLNYTGQNIKMLRTFFNWLNSIYGIHTGPYHRNFYICKEETAITTLTVEQLQFLLFDKNFEARLSKALQHSKDVFVVGCLVGLRYSDLRKIKLQNIELRNGHSYLKMRSQKTNIETLVRLPEPALDIFNKYRKNKKAILPAVSLFRFNENIKKMAELAGWVGPLAKMQKPFRLSKVKTADKSIIRFCDAISSHIMRRTSITTMLTSGMKEHIVRKISGHTSDSKSFFRYVNLAQSLMDEEIEKMHIHFKNPNSEIAI